ncbi:MaoC family dehydratase [Rhodococcus olei]|uniref:MaoC family dehydratase n=1 Tax=Rhodococcus olei TaxID=2161675 RepID=UPI0031E516EF
MPDPQPRVFTGIADLEAAVGHLLGRSEWCTVTQERITAFADATGDHQWIHVDPDRAASGPFGGTIAHGYLTLSLLPVLLRDIYRIEGVRMAVNYGCNRLRFPAAVPVGSRLRAGATLARVERTEHGARMTVDVVVEREGGDKPVCIAESVTVLFM